MIHWRSSKCKNEIQLIYSRKQRPLSICIRCFVCVSQAMRAYAKPNWSRYKLLEYELIFIWWSSTGAGEWTTLFIYAAVKRQTNEPGRNRFAFILNSIPWVHGMPTRRWLFSVRVSQKCASARTHRIKIPSEAQPLIYPFGCANVCAVRACTRHMHICLENWNIISSLPNCAVCTLHLLTVSRAVPGWDRDAHTHNG